MKKWFLALSLVCCSLLFFVTGSFLGYLTFEQKLKAKPQEKSYRKPSERLAPILGRVVQNQKVTITSKVRIPTPNAVMKAQRYKERYFAVK